MKLKSFTQFLKEDDFTYTTNQNKTDEHAKSFCRNYIDNCKVELRDNGLTATGKLKQKYVSDIVVSADTGITVGVEMIDFLVGMINHIITKMTEDRTITIKQNTADNTVQAYGSKDQAVLEIEYDFSGTKYTGDGTVVISGIISDDKLTNTVIDFTGDWNETK